MAEKSFGIDPRQLSDPGAQIRRGFRGLKADAPHAGVHGEVERRGLALTQRLGGQGLGILPEENGHPDVLPDGLGKGGHRHPSQHQNGLADAASAQLQRFGDVGGAEEGAQRLQDVGNRHGAQAVGVGLDHREDVGAGGFAHQPEIIGYGIQIHLQPGLIELHEINSCSNFPHSITKV